MTTAQQTFVIVGAGLDGAAAAEALRREGFDGRIVLMGEDAERPYDRPRSRRTTCRVSPTWPVGFRDDVAKGEFIAFWMGAGVLAGMNVNIWDATDAIQTLVRAGRPVNPAQLANPAVPLEDLGGGTLEGAP